MDRQQKIVQVNSQSGRVSKVSNLGRDPRFINPDYKCEPCDGILSETGKLVVFKLVPISGSGPYFTARWDQKPEHLDIDMHDAPNRAIRDFKNNRNGYSGHHTCRTTDPDRRIFEVKIETPAGVIFDGTVSFSNAYEMITVEQSIFQDVLDGVVVKAAPEGGCG